MFCNFLVFLSALLFEAGKAFSQRHGVTESLQFLENFIYFFCGRKILNLNILKRSENSSVSTSVAVSRNVVNSLQRKAPLVE